MNKIWTSLSFTSLSFFTTVLSSASPSHAVSLEESLTHGYKYDENVRVIQADFMNEIEQFPQVLSEFMPKIKAVLDNSKQSVTNLSKSNTVTDNISRKSDHYSQSLVVDQSLFSGGASVARLKAAQSAFRSSRASYYNKEQEVLLRQIETYLNTVEAQEKYQISQTSVNSNAKQLEASKEKLRLGESTETEVASAEAGLAAAEANKALAHANYEAAAANFRRLFGIEPENLVMPMVPDGLPDSLDTLIQKALALNLDLQSVHNSTKIVKAKEYAAKAVLLPQVNLSVQSTRDSYTPQSVNTSELNRKGVSSVVSVTIPILQRGGAEYSDIRRSKYDTRKVMAQLDSQQKKVRSDSQSEWHNYLASKERILAAEKGVQAAQVAYDGIVQEERLGSKTIVDVLTMEERLNKAKETKVEADKALVIAGYRIKALTGETTAKSLNLPVKYFEPEREFNILKRKIVGF